MKIQRKRVGYKFLTQSGLAEVVEVLSKKITVVFLETGNVVAYAASGFKPRLNLTKVDPKGKKYENSAAYYPDFKHDFNQENYVFRGWSGKSKHERRSFTEGEKETQVFRDFYEFMTRPDKSVNGVSPEHAEKHPDYVDDNSSNVGCWNCVKCIDCDYCIDCENCIDCVNCSDCDSCTLCTKVRNSEYSFKQKGM